MDGSLPAKPEVGGGGLNEYQRVQRTHRQQLQTLCMPHAARQWLRWDDDRADTSGCFWPNSVVGEWLRTTYSVDKLSLSLPADFLCIFSY